MFSNFFMLMWYRKKYSNFSFSFFNSRSPSEHSGRKGCCGQFFQSPKSLGLIAMIALGGVACALGGAAWGASGLAGQPSTHLTVSLLMIGKRRGFILSFEVDELIAKFSEQNISKDEKLFAIQNPFNKNGKFLSFWKKNVHPQSFSFIFCELFICNCARVIWNKVDLNSLKRKVFSKASVEWEITFAPCTCS